MCWAPFGSGVYRSRSGSSSKMKSSGSIILLGAFIVLMTACLYAIGLAWLKRFQQSVADNLQSSKLEHFVSFVRFNPAEFLIRTGKRMIGLHGAEFEARFLLACRFIVEAEGAQQSMWRLTLSKGQDHQILKLGLYFYVLAVLILALWCVQTLSALGAGGINTTSPDWPLEAGSVLVVWLALFVGLARLAALQMNTKVDLLRHRLEIRLPNLLDLWVIGLEAGQAPGASLLSALEQSHSSAFEPVRRRLKRELEGGLAVSDAMSNLGKALSIKAFTSLSQLLDIAVTQGGPIAERLKQFAEQMRLEMFLAAENDALKAPLRLLAPLVMLIFPSTFIVLLFPVFYQLIKEFGG